LSRLAGDPTIGSPIMRDRSPPPETLAQTLSTRDGRDAYLAENGFTVASYDDKWTKASFFALDFSIPNTDKHRRAIMLHDLHHVATGYGTDLTGEGEISAWELRGGLRGLDLYVSAIVVGGALAGLLLAPRRTLRAFRAARGARSLWTTRARYDDLLAMQVGELRSMLGVPPTGVASEPRALHKNAPGPALS
jgi:hypothetical protein